MSCNNSNKITKHCWKGTKYFMCVRIRSYTCTKSQTKFNKPKVTRTQLSNESQRQHVYRLSGWGPWMACRGPKRWYKKQNDKCITVANQIHNYPCILVICHSWYSCSSESYLFVPVKGDLVWSLLGCKQKVITYSFWYLTFPLASPNSRTLGLPHPSPTKLEVFQVDLTIPRCSMRLE